MQSTKTTGSLSLHVLLFLGVTNLIFDFCAAAQIPERFFYNNDGRIQLNVAPATAATETEDADTKLRLLEDGQKDPIPLEFYQQMNNVTDFSEFIQRFVAEDSVDRKLGLQEKVYNNVERAAANIPRVAGCEPQNELVELLPWNLTMHPDVSYFPKCTRVKRCSGCCNSPLISCQPIEEEVVDFQVIKYRYSGGKLRAEGQEHVLVKQHNSCKCDCRVKKEDCNSRQVYDPAMCQCICTNGDARRKCFAQEGKFWDIKECSCRCLEEEACTTGTIFDWNQCRCIEDPIPESALFDRRRFILKAIEVDPNNSTLYNTTS